MKKYLRIAFMSLFAIVIVSLTAFFLVNYFENENSQGKLPFISQQPLTATTAAPTTATPTTTTQPVETEPMIDLDALSIIDLYPLSLAGGSWDVKHCQGIAVDKKRGYIYYSYTTILVKCSMEDGSIVGTVNVPGGHLGDIAFNEKDGRIYCGYYTTGRKGFYIVIFDVDKITKSDMKPTSDIVRTVFVKDAWDDYCSTVTFTEETTQQSTQNVETQTTAKAKTYSYSHRYGTSAIDGVTFGPDFSGKIKNKELLTVAYGIYPDTTRNDNDYQVLLQYDVSSWWSTIAKPYSTTTFHRSCPESANGKYFLYTGNTYYGVQTMEYFDELNLWILCCYRKDRKEQFMPFSIFAIDGDVAPVLDTIKNQPTEEKQLVLSLYHDGQYDSKNDLYGWNSSYGVQGIAYMGDGLFYIVRPYKSWTGTKTAICYLNVWSGENPDPFTLAAGIGNDYSISKKLR